MRVDVTYKYTHIYSVGNSVGVFCWCNDGILLIFCSYSVGIFSVSCWYSVGISPATVLSHAFFSTLTHTRMTSVM